MSWIPSLSSLSNSVSNWVEGAVDRVSLVTLVYPVAAPELGASGPGGSVHDDPAVAVAATWETSNDGDDADADLDRDGGSSDDGGDLGDLEDPLGAQAAAAAQRARRRREPYPEAALPELTYRREMSLHFNGGEIELRHFSHAHTKREK